MEYTVDHYKKVLSCIKGEPYDPWECMKWTTKFGVAYATEGGFCHRGERKE